MAKIKCSICSYQFNIWYAGHSLAHILIWFLAFDYGSEVYLTLVTGCLGIALQPSAAHLRTMKTTLNASQSITSLVRRVRRPDWALEYARFPCAVAHDPRALRVRNPCRASIKGVVRYATSKSLEKWFQDKNNKNYTQVLCSLRRHIY